MTARPLQPDDWAALFDAAADPGVWAQHPASERYTEPEFRRFFEGAIASGSAFALIDRAVNLMVGSSRYHGHEPLANEIEIGWTFLARSHWGLGYNAEIKHLMLDHAFKYVATVVFWVGQENLRSRRAMEKLGGVRRAGVYFRDLSGDEPSVVYEICKCDWTTGEPG